jgi:hypothetical protein
VGGVTRWIYKHAKVENNKQGNYLILCVCFLPSNYFLR